MNTLLALDAPAHDWYRFVLSFPPHLVRDYAQRFGLDSNSYVLDPFCGTGTTLVEAKKLGVPSCGLEAVPVSRLAASTNFTNYRTRTLLYAGKPNWALLETLTPT